MSWLVGENLAVVLSVVVVIVIVVEAGLADDNVGLLIE